MLGLSSAEIGCAFSVTPRSMDQRLTRARRRLHVYVPAIFHHRPQGSDDAHGLGQASRYLSPEVQGLFTTTRPPAPGLAGRGGTALGPPGGGTASEPSLRDRMSVQALFEM